MDGITESAAVRLAALLDEVKEPETRSVRLKVTERGEELAIDDQREEDKAYKYAERTVLVIDPETAKKYAGRKLDLRDNRFCIV